MLDTRKKMGYTGLLALNFMSMFLIAAPVAGLICKYDWRITFYVSVPALVLITLLCAAGPPRSEKSAGGGRMDVAGSLFCALMLVPFCLAMSLGSLKGWTSPLMLVFSALMNSSGGMVTMFRFPIAMFVVMAIFGIFLFRDIKSGETL